jgi:hypothetical protein
VFAPVHYAVTWAPQQSTSETGTHLGYVREDVGLQVPIYVDPVDRLSSHFSFRNYMFQTNTILPDSHVPFPSDLTSIQGGLSYQHRFANNWVTGISGSVGSASDKPFHSINEMNFGVSGFLRIPAFAGRDSWLFSISYQPTGQLAFPLPGVAYLWNPNPNFRMSIGLPFSLWWRPIETVFVTANYVPLTNITARVTWVPVKQFAVFTGYESGGSSFQLADRTDTRDRFRINEDRFVSGVRYTPVRWATVEVSGGYMFDRRFFQSSGGGSATGGVDRINVSPGPFLAASLWLRW